MKKKIVNFIHSVFRLPLFEKFLRPLAKDNYVNSVVAKFVPPNHSYQNPTFRIANNGRLSINANLFDYNDWKAYWSLKEVERDWLYELASGCKTVIDVGVNNGWVLMNMASRVEKNDGFVYGFEPHPNTFARCLKNIEKSGIMNCKVFNMGCGEMESEFKMSTIKESNSGQNRIITGETEAERTVTVKVVPLDKELGHLQDIGLIKIDVEGFEMHVLKGAKELLDTHKPILFVEVDDILLKSNNSSAKELLTYLLENFGYQFKNATNRKIITDLDSLNKCHLDVVCMPVK